jgi:osmotically-inducible protein OsmY
MANEYRRNYEDELRRQGRRGWTDRPDEEVGSWFTSDDPRARRGNDERDDRFPYGGDRDRSWRDQGDGSYEHGAEPWRSADRGAGPRYPGDRGHERERHGFRPSAVAGGRHWQGGAREHEDYTGRGPKDYRRSDERIREEISDRLTDDYRVDASDITVQVKDGEVTLTGTVATREQKRRAEDLVETTSGVRDVTNGLRVHRDGPSGTGMPRSGSAGVGTDTMTAGDRQQPVRRSSSTAS